MRDRSTLARRVCRRCLTLPALVALFLAAGASAALLAAAGRADPATAQAVETSDGSSAPVVTIEGAPRIESYHEYHHFAFSADVPGSDFFCSLDDGPFAPCTSGAYRYVSYDLHTFSVYAVGPDGTRGEAAVEYESRDPNWD